MDYVKEIGKSSLSYALKESLKMDFKDCSLQDKVTLLEFYSKMVELIGDLGWHEHTSDWDLNTVIKMKSGAEFHTMVGYPEVCLIYDGPEAEFRTICLDYEKAKKLMILLKPDEHEDQEEPVQTYISVENLLSIELND